MNFSNADWWGIRTGLELLMDRAWRNHDKAHYDDVKETWKKVLVELDKTEKEKLHCEDNRCNEDHNWLV